MVYIKTRTQQTSSSDKQLRFVPGRNRNPIRLNLETAVLALVFSSIAAAAAYAGLAAASDAVVGVY